MLSSVSAHYFTSAPNQRKQVQRLESGLNTLTKHYFVLSQKTGKRKRGKEQLWDTTINMLTELQVQSVIRMYRFWLFKHFASRAEILMVLSVEHPYWIVHTGEPGRRCLTLGPSRQLAGRSLQKTSYVPYTLSLSEIIIKQQEKVDKLDRTLLYNLRSSPP